MQKFRWLLILFTMMIAQLAVSVSAAGGTGPGDALLPIGQAQTVAPHSAQWYHFDYDASRTKIFARVDDNGARGIYLSIYTPEEIANWSRGEKLVAIGRGSPVQGHDLGWVGQFDFAGTFYAVIDNDSDVPVAVVVNVTGEGVKTLPPPTLVPTLAPLPNPFTTLVPVSKGVGGRIAFVDSAGGNLYVVNGDGSNLRRVSFGIDPQWNHEGTQIALAREGPVPGIFVIDPNGSNESLVASAAQVRAPDWSPDDSQIVFSYRGKVKLGFQICVGRFLCIDLPRFKPGEVKCAGSECIDIPELPENGVCFRRFCLEETENPIWSLAVYNSNNGTIDGARATKHAFTPTWNRDRVTIAYNDPALGITRTFLKGEVEPFPFVGDLRAGLASYSPQKLMSPQYSPDGGSIVYMVDQPPAWQIAIANADGSNQHLLTRRDLFDFVHPNNVAPVWSPDGTKILFLSDRNGKWEFFTMNSDGSNVQQVLKNVTDQFLLFYEYESERMASWTK